MVFSVFFIFPSLSFSFLFSHLWRLLSSSLFLSFPFFPVLFLSSLSNPSFLLFLSFFPFLSFYTFLSFLSFHFFSYCFSVHKRVFDFSLLELQSLDSGESLDLSLPSSDITWLPVSSSSSEMYILPSIHRSLQSKVPRHSTSNRKESTTFGPYNLQLWISQGGSKMASVSPFIGGTGWWHLAFAPWDSLSRAAHELATFQIRSLCQEPAGSALGEGRTRWIGDNLWSMSSEKEANQEALGRHNSHISKNMPGKRKEHSLHICWFPCSSQLESCLPKQDTEHKK